MAEDSMCSVVKVKEITKFLLRVAPLCIANAHADFLTVA
jgi:hypothetical protein